MIRFLNKRRTTLALLLWFVFVFLNAYISLGSNVEKNSSPDGNTVSIKSNKTTRATPAVVKSLMLDSDNDGIPDGAELRSYEDRERFRHWFTHIAEMQFYRTSEQWNSEQRDCA